MVQNVGYHLSRIPMCSKAPNTFFSACFQVHMLFAFMPSLLQLFSACLFTGINWHQMAMTLAIA